MQMCVWKQKKSERGMEFYLSALSKRLLLQLEFLGFLYKLARGAAERSAAISHRAALDVVAPSDIGTVAHLHV